MNQQTTLTGRISYISDKDSDRGREHGSERFTITRRADNHMVQRAHCRITDPPHVERDSVLAVDGAMRPTDSYVRIETQGSFTGVAWYRFSENRAECEAFTRDGGRQHYQETVESEPFPFCSHALVGDAWMLACVAPLKDGQRRAIRLLTSTLNKQGATGPALATKAYGVERVGLETIVVPAGTFSTLHLRSGEVETPQQLASADFSYDIWVTDDEYRLAVLSMYKGKARYQLTELSRSND
jgi:hypothetical protein